MFAVCEGIKCIAGQTQMAQMIGQEFVNNLSSTSTAPTMASNTSLPAVAAGPQQIA